MSTMKFVAVTAITLLMAWPAFSGTTAKDPYQYFFETSFGDYKEELARAKSEGKKAVMLFFELDDCPFCHRMKETILNQPDVQAYFREHFLLFAVDIEGQTDVVGFDGKSMKEKDFAEKVHRVRATPVIAFFDMQGKSVARVTGATTKEEFLWLGEFVAGEHFKNETFVKYKRAKRGN